MSLNSKPVSQLSDYAKSIKLDKEMLKYQTLQKSLPSIQQRYEYELLDADTQYMNELEI